MRVLTKFPFLVILIGIASAAMYLPAIHAVSIRDHHTARAFFYSGTLFLFFAVVLGLSSYQSRPRNLALSHLIALPLFFTFMPFLLAFPFWEAVGNTTFLNAYFEMVSSLTTTGATLFDDPARLAPSVHLWRALVGWMGGFFVWVTALAILAPLNLGGFEVISSQNMGQGAQQDPLSVRMANTRELLLRFSGQLLPIYGGITGALWLLLILSGEERLIAVCHAMSVIATSGISPVGGLENGLSGLTGEIFMFLFLGFALSRQTFTPETGREGWGRLLRDPEINLGLTCVAVIPMLLFLRHWLGAYEVDDQENTVAALRALWGSVFSVLSFLTTTGFVSGDWAEARVWSGLQTPGMVLLGLALIGGGVATTAGGVKLLRVYALYKHGVREMDKLVHPSSVGGAGVFARHIRRRGAYVAWIFFMMFALSIALIMTLLSLTGLGFEDVSILTVAALSTTGPVAQVAGEVPISFSELDSAGKVILSGAMILGRLEMLAIIALLNPEFWRQ